MKHLMTVLVVLVGLSAQSIVGAADTGASQIRAELADDELNSVYFKLRNNLPASEQATLRAEQREWLKQRDRLRKDSPEYAAFIESRVEVLENRLEQERDQGR